MSDRLSIKGKYYRRLTWTTNKKCTAEICITRMTRDLPDNVVAVGNPCRVLREINEHDREFYFKDRKIDYSKL